MKRILMAAALLAAASATPAFAQSAGEKTGVNSALGIAPKTEDFIKEAAMSDMLEIEAAKVAQQKGDADDKKFADMMITDHTKASENLQRIASAKNITLPATLGDDAKKDSSDLSKKSGGDFDKAYMSMMVDDHNDDIDDFQKEADKGNDPDSKAWASNKLPVLQHHLQMAKDIQQSLKK